jgi:hypothetical protein
MPMIESNQVERLKKDSRELGHYIHKLHKKGKQDIAHKIARRQSFLDDAISQVETRIARG